jgi:hypothetical protein
MKKWRADSGAAGGGQQKHNFGEEEERGDPKRKIMEKSRKKNANILFVAIDKNHADSSVGVRPHL